MKEKLDNSYWGFLNKSKYLYWKGFCSDDRYSAVNIIEKIINKYGYITDYHMFSDMELSIKIELQAKKNFDLYNELKNYLMLNDYKNIKSKSTKECVIFLNITFLKSTGDLKIEVPVVPG